MRAALSLLLVALLASPLAAGADRWRELQPGLRWLHRVGRWSDGAPTELHVVTVDRCAPGVAFRATAPSEGFSQVDRWARSVDALVAVNGDYYLPRTRSALALARGAGRWWPTPARLEHRDALLAFDARGAVQIFHSPDPLRPWLLGAPPAGFDARYTEAVAAREQVLEDGSARLSPHIEHDGRRHPRTGVGFSADGRTWVFVVVDGRRPGASGARPEELAEVLREHGARQGFKLDGGGSSALYLAGFGVVNRPSDGRVRAVANHLGVLRSAQRSGCAP